MTAEATHDSAEVKNGFSLHQGQAMKLQMCDTCGVRSQPDPHTGDWEYLPITVDFAANSRDFTADFCSWACMAEFGLKQASNALPPEDLPC